MLRYFLPTFFLAYIALAFIFPIVRVWRITGQNPLVLGSSDSAHDFIGRIFKLLFALLAVVIAIYAASETFYQYLKPSAWITRSEVQFAGVVLLLVSLAWTMLAQFQMRDSWRIGVDYKTKTDLVRSGVFRYSRNPIFLGVQATLLGVFLTIPNALTLLILVLGAVLIHIQVRLEEEFLKASHGSEYDDYRRGTRRWL